MGESDPPTPATEHIGHVVRQWRKHRGMTMQALAAEMDFDRSYISHVEAGRHDASAAFAQRAERALNAGGEIWAAWQQTGGEPPTAITTRSSSGLVVEHDHAELRYDGTVFHATMRRTIVNAGPDPVTRYLVRISVDRHPGNPEASNRLYRAHPLTFDELQLTARCGSEPMTWRPKLDRDAFKEVWLCFDNDQGRFPLYPGQRATLEYSYQVSDTKWGPWFQRAIRLPTMQLSVRVAFPASLHAQVWGTETSTTAEATALHKPISHQRDRSPHGEMDIYDWDTADPPVGARYRIEWRFRVNSEPPEPRPDLTRASDRMKAAGIVQQGDPILATTAAPFHLPEQADEAQQLIDELLDAMQRVREHHVFGKGMGLAAPQIGVSRAAAIVQPPGDDAAPITLLNPRVIEESTQTDEQYEGCLSLFDVRGLAVRPLRLEVAHTALTGEQAITVFHDGLARLVAHEIDHLNGRLYLERMREGTNPISVQEYKGTGQQWGYPTR